MDVNTKLVSIAGLSVAILSSCYASDVLGQQGRTGRANEQITALTSPSRELLSLLSEAEKNIADQQWSEATLALGKILGLEELTESNSQDFGVDRFYNPVVSDLGDEGKQIHGSLFEHVYKLLDQMPDEAIQVLEVRHGVDASNQLNSAIENGDWKSIEKLSSRFCFLPTGQDARILLAQRAIAQGDAISGAIILDSLLKYTRASNRFGASLSLSAAQAFLMGGEPSRAKEILKDAIAKYPSFEGKLNDSLAVRWTANENLDETTAKLLETLNPQAKSGSRSLTITKRTESPLVPGGDSRRNADTSIGFPLPLLRWHSELQESNQQKKLAENELFTQLASSANSASTVIPSRQAISTGNSVICATYDQRIVAVDLQTGLLQWECVFTGVPLGFPLEFGPPFGGSGQESESTLPDHLRKRIWLESIYGSISADRENLYSISDVSSLELVSNANVAAPNRFGMMPQVKTNNVLQCWSIAQEGKLIWEIGGESNNSDTRLETAYFLGAPLPFENQLLVIAELNGEVNLLSLSPKDGKLNWAQPLVVNESIPVVNDAFLRVTGLSPTVDGNIVLCPTLSGNLVAFDMHTRELQWSFAYRRKPNNAGIAGQFAGPMQLGDFDPFTNRSVDLSAVTSDGTVIYAPPDGYGIHAIDLATGKRKWQALLEDYNSLRYVGGIAGNCVVAVEQKQLHGFNKDTGVTLWPTVVFPDNAEVVGRGARNGNLYYVPLSNFTILEVDLLTGKTRTSEPLANLPGNLTNVGERLISVSPLQMECYVVAESFKSRLAAVNSNESVASTNQTTAEVGTAPNASDVQRSSKDIQTLIDLGELELLMGNVDKSLSLLEEAYQLAPNNRDVWVRLKSAAMTALKSDFKKYADRVTNYDIGLESDETYLRFYIQTLIDQGQAKGAFEKLISMSDHRIQGRARSLKDKDYVKIDSSSIMDVDRWIQWQLQNTLQLLASQIDSPEFVKVIEVQKKRLASIGPAAQRLKLNHFRAFNQFDEERVALAKTLFTTGQKLAAEHFLMEILDELPYSEWLQRKPDAAKLLIRLYSNAGRDNLLSEIAAQNKLPLDELYRLNTEEDDLELSQNLGPSTLRELRLDSPKLDSDSILENSSPTNLNEWPKGNAIVEVSRQANQHNQTSASFKTKPIIAVGSTLTDGTADYLNLSGVMDITNRFGDAWSVRTGQGLFSSQHGSIRTALIDGNLILVGASRLIAIDTWDGHNNPQKSDLWMQTFDTLNSEFESARHIPGLDFDDIGGMSSSQQGKPQSYWGLKQLNDRLKIVFATRHELVVLVNDELVGIAPMDGRILWKTSGYRDAKIAADDNFLYCWLPSEKIVKVDVRSGTKLGEQAAAPSLQYTQPVFDKFLQADESKNLIRLIKASDGSTILERKLTADFQLALSDNFSRLIALGNNGEYVFWNLTENKEFNHKIELRDNELTQRSPNSRKFSTAMDQITLAEFEDRILVLPYRSRFGYDNTDLFPKQFDGNYALVSGSVFAVSPTDGSPLWEKSLPVLNYAFPLQQSRKNTPAAVMVRRINFPRLIKNAAYQIVGFGLIDLRDGSVLYEKDDQKGDFLPSFTQRLTPSSRSMRCSFSGIDFLVTFDDAEGANRKSSLGDPDIKNLTERVINIYKPQTSQDSLPPASPNSPNRFPFE